MRALQSLATVALFLLAIAGYGFGIWLIHAAMSGPKSELANAVGIFGALAIAAPALIIATVALGAFGVMVTIECAREDRAIAEEAALAAQREQIELLKKALYRT